MASRDLSSPGRIHGCRGAIVMPERNRDSRRGPRRPRNVNERRQLGVWRRRFASDGDDGDDECCSSRQTRVRLRLGCHLAGSLAACCGGVLRRRDGRASAFASIVARHRRRQPFSDERGSMSEHRGCALGRTYSRSRCPSAKRRRNRDCARASKSSSRSRMVIGADICGRALVAGNVAREHRARDRHPPRPHANYARAMATNIVDGSPELSRHVFVGSSFSVRRPRARVRVCSEYAQNMLRAHSLARWPGCTPPTPRNNTAPVSEMALTPPSPPNRASSVSSTTLHCSPAGNARSG